MNDRPLQFVSAVGADGMDSIVALYVALFRRLTNPTSLFFLPSLAFYRGLQFNFDKYSLYGIAFHGYVAKLVG